MAKFDAPLTGNIQTAILSLHLQKVRRGGAINIHAVTEPWSEDDVTYDSRPTFESVPFATVNVNAGDSGKNITVDITDQVHHWIQGANFGMAPQSAGARVTLDSKEIPNGTLMAIEVAGSGAALFTREPRQKLNVSVSGAADTVFGCDFPNSQVISCGYTLDPQAGGILVPFNMVPGQAGENCEIGFFNHGPNPAVDVGVILHARCLAP